MKDWTSKYAVLTWSARGGPIPKIEVYWSHDLATIAYCQAIDQGQYAVIGSATIHPKVTSYQKPKKAEASAESDDNPPWTLAGYQRQVRKIWNSRLKAPARKKAKKAKRKK